MSNLTQDFAEKVVATFCPTTKVKITDGSDGVYLTKTNEIHCGKDWSVSGLLHEIAHAKYYLEENKTGHDGRYADILTRITDEYMNSGISYLYQDSKSKTTPWLAGDFLVHKELECTRNALDKAKQDLEIARNALEDIKSDYELYADQGCRMEPNETDMYNYACKALEQIEHKEQQ